ncbi:MAG: hypothetical protein NC819_02095 [Candidatus Omnitrophica bacterium]|nr:hypothetical protein [Candidatus Omnitrophota bacterium]
MGRWRWDKKTTVEECRSLSTAKFRDWGIFKPAVGFASGTVQWKNSSDEVIASIGYSFSQTPSPRLTVFYTITRSATGEKQDFNYFIELATVPCRFGGLRYWFICPLVKDGCPCLRRVSKLYFPPSATYFGCRHCYNLTYESCQEHDARVDRLCKNPLALYQMMNNKDPRTALLGIKAAFKVRGML